MSDVTQVARRPLVMVFNSDPAFLRLMDRLLHDEGYRSSVHVITDLAVDEIRMLGPDLLIIDVAPGDNRGWMLLDGIHDSSDLSAIPLIVASTQERLAERAATSPKYEVEDILIKPFAIEELYEKVERLIGQLPANP
jgi:DNA-binding response OmpR family regulator